VLPSSHHGATQYGRYSPFALYQDFFSALLVASDCRSGATSRPRERQLPPPWGGRRGGATRNPRCSPAGGDRRMQNWLSRMQGRDDFCLLFRTGGKACRLVICVGLIASLGCKQTAMELDRLVPQELGGWRLETPGRVYDRDTLFDYIDGGAELYLAYSFRQVLSCRFRKTGHPDIVVDLFDMHSSQDAFGVFSAEWQEPEAGIGQGSEYAAGLLRFWKGHFFVSVWAEQETAETRKAVLDLGTEIAGAIGPPGPLPDLLKLVPAPDLIGIGVRYFHDHASLNLHYFLADQNILGLGARTEAVLAPYQTSQGAVHLLLARYPTDDDAQRALDSFETAYLPEGPAAATVQKGPQGWVAAERRGNVIVIVLDAPDRGQAEEMLARARQRMEKAAS